MLQVIPLLFSCFTTASPEFVNEEQLLMAAVFLDHAIIQHCDLVRHAHGGEAMTSAAT